MAVRNSRQAALLIADTVFAERCAIIAARVARTVSAEVTDDAPTRARKAFAARFLTQPEQYKATMALAAAGALDTAAPVSDPTAITDPELTTALAAAWSSMAGA